MSERRSVLTIATGKKLYLDLALNLARSFFWWHPNTNITFQLATDQQEHIPADIGSKIQVIKINPGELGEGFSPKLFLDRLASEGQTLFIDSDCLIFGDLTRVFDAFKGHKVSVVGNYIADGEWFGDIKKICTDFKLPHLPKFNGGIYYLEKGPEADKVYKIARDLEKQYDEVGFVRLRNRPNDEVLMALAMQLEGMTPLIDDGSIMSDPQACPGKYQLDVLNGRTLLINPPLPDVNHRDWYPFEKISPLVVHFLGYYTQHYPYRREVYRLEKALNNNLNWFNNLKSLIVIEYSDRLKKFIKNTFRSTYHKLAGVRKVKSSERMLI
jgi:hypothetical protein